MRVTQHLTAVACFVIVMLSTSCLSQKGWKPQGRFGKRADKVARPAYPDQVEIPIESLYTAQQITQFMDKPTLCSVTGLPDYPACQYATIPGTKDSDSLRMYYDL